MGLRSVERRLERFVQGSVGRVFRGGVRPVQIGHRIAQTMDDSRSVGVRGQPVVANHYTVALAPDDFEQFADVADSLTRELCQAARDHAREEGYSFMGPVQIEMVPDEKGRIGSFDVLPRMKEADGGVGVLLLPTGDEVVLGEYIVTMGRLADCTIAFDDTNVSRNHAEIRPEGDGFVLVDLNSTNGVSVNGVRVSRHRLVDGDRITIGATMLDFRAG